MANIDEFEEELPDTIRQQLDDETGPIEDARRKEPIYKVYKDARIPVSKHHGKVWQGRKDAAKKAREKYEEAWQEAIRYFCNDQLEHRDSPDFETSGNQYVSRRMNDNWSETENIVFANITTTIPALYAKNPQVEMTAETHNNDKLATVFEHLINSVLRLKNAPGVNLKPKLRKSILNALLTNAGWIKVGYNLKEDSSEEVLNELADIGEKLSKAKKQSVILELEGKLMAIEKHLEVITPEGPITKFVSPFNMYVDPESVEPDYSDASWMIECDYLPTEYVNARYGQKKGKEIVSSYSPTHVLKANSQETDPDQLITNFSLFSKDDDSPARFGYEDEDAYKSAQRTLVWYCWDKITRRMYMFHDTDWSWPIWVWDDPYKLLGFFPYRCLSFYHNPEGQYAKGEVTYYLDQQDAVNEINSEERLARHWARRNVFFDETRIDREDVEKVLKGPDGTARGVRLPEGMTLKDVLFTFASPGISGFPEIFNVDRKLAAIDRISSVSDVMRGVQFKTNTTNKAIESYNSSTQLRIDEKIDIIEDFVGEIAWMLLQLCVQFMDASTVANLIGEENAQGWQPMSPQDLANQVNLTVVGGSTAKPTSRAKKEEAIEAGQVLGQFADASPAVVIILLRLFQQAFDEIVLKDEDWQMIIDTMMAQQQQAGAGPQGAGGQPQQGGGSVEEIIQQLPPQAQQAIQTATQQGVPVEEATRRVVEALEGGQQGRVQ